MLSFSRTIGRVGTMALFSWGTAVSKFSLSVGSSESQKKSFGQIWTLPYLATSKIVNFGFLIKKQQYNRPCSPRKPFWSYKYRYR